MSVRTLPPPDTRADGGRRTVGLLALLVVLAVAPYLAGVLVPYYVNDLDELPLAEVAGGGHDPKDLWPQGFIGGWVQAGGFFSLGLTPILLLVALGGCAATLWSGRPWARSRWLSPAAAAGLVVISAVCVGALAFFSSPLGSALMTWRMD